MTTPCNDLYDFDFLPHRDTGCAAVVPGDSESRRSPGQALSRVRTRRPEAASSHTAGSRRPRSSHRKRRARPPLRRYILAILGLVLAAQPGGAFRLALDRGCAAIAHELHKTLAPDGLDSRSMWAGDIAEVMRDLDVKRPKIAEVSGHVSSNASGHIRGEPHERPPRHHDMEGAAGTGVHLAYTPRSGDVGERAPAQ